VLEVSDLTFLVTRQVDSTYCKLHLIDRYCAVVSSPSCVGG